MRSRTRFSRALRTVAGLAAGLLALGAAPAVAAPVPAVPQWPAVANWSGNPVALVEVQNVTVEALPDVRHVGRVEGFLTMNPRLTCLNGWSLDVYVAPSEFPGQYVVHDGASCGYGTWVFPQVAPGPADLLVESENGHQLVAACDGTAYVPVGTEDVEYLVAGSAATWSTGGSTAVFTSLSCRLDDHSGGSYGGYSNAQPRGFVTLGGPVSAPLAANPRFCAVAEALFADGTRLFTYSPTC